MSESFHLEEDLIDYYSIRMMQMIKELIGQEIGNVYENNIHLIPCNHNVSAESLIIQNFGRVFLELKEIPDKAVPFDLKLLKNMISVMKCPEDGCERFITNISNK